MNPPREAGPDLCVSAIVPVFDDAANLSECLAALDACRIPGCEILVVDDGSSDGSPTVAQRFAERILHSQDNAGPARARNHGAAQARADIFFFVDSDVVVAPGAMARVVATLDGNSDIAAVFGSYDDHPRAEGVVSRYRNLLHHYTHQRSRAEASTFWAACGAIRRRVFVEIGGFDATRYRHPSVEDIELGYRLREAGHRILLDKGLQATHLKRWTVCSMIHIDVFRRAIPWARLILERDSPSTDLNLRRGQRLSIAMTAVAFTCLVMSAVWPKLSLCAAAAILVVLFWNREWFRFLSHRGGVMFAAACIPLHLIHLFCAGLGYVLAYVDFRARQLMGAVRRRGQNASASVSS